MTKKILIDEAVVKQVLEWIEDAAVVLSHTSTAIQGGLGAEAEGVGGCSVKVLKDLREVLEVNNKGVNALAEQPDYSICPTCGGMASDPIVPVEARQQAPEPVAWRYQDARGHYRYRGYVDSFDKEYPQLKPVQLWVCPAPTQQYGTNGVVALQERLRQEPVALQPLTAAQVLALYQKWGTGRLDGFTEAIREYEAALGIEGK